MDNKSELDSMLSLVENSIRRQIIRRLSQEASYPLEIAKEIGVGQQLVTNHLAYMERSGFVGSSFVTSPIGPKRRFYFLKRSAYLTVSFGPHLFNEKFFTFETPPSKLSKDALTLLSRIDEIKRAKENKQIESLANLIADIDEKIEKIEDEKTVLLYIRNLAMKETSKAIESQTTHDERRILHFILDMHSKDIENMSNTLNLKESTIREILEKLKTKQPNI